MELPPFEVECWKLFLMPSVRLVPSKEPTRTYFLYVPFHLKMEAKPDTTKETYAIASIPL
jgi:hypothetical protein